MKKWNIGCWLRVVLMVLVLSSSVVSAEETLTNAPSVRGNIGVQIHMLSSTLASSDVFTSDGFEVNSSSGGPILSLQGNLKKFSLEVTIPTSSPKYELLFFGSSMGEVEVATSTVTLKWYPYEWRPDAKFAVLPYVGMGQQMTSASGHYSMGGMIFPESYDERKWVWQGGAEFTLLTKYTKNLLAVVDYKSVGVDYRTQVPNGPTIKISIDPVVSFGLGFRF